MKVGDLVKVKTKHEGEKLALVISKHFHSVGVEWMVQRLDGARLTLCQSCDLEVVSESR